MKVCSSVHLEQQLYHAEQTRLEPCLSNGFCDTTGNYYINGECTLGN